MRPLVVDASVAVKWFVSEEGSPAATRLLSRRNRLLAPDLLRSEVGNVIWRLFRRGVLGPDEADELVKQFLAMPIGFHGSEGLLALAVQVAVQTGVTVYDAMYVALALREDCRCITADERLLSALSDTPFRRQVRRLASSS